MNAAQQMPDVTCATADAKTAMHAALEHALGQDQLRLLYQPLADLQTGAVVSLEALLRWQHPTMGLLSAPDFLPHAEQAGLMADIGLWVLGRVGADLQAWPGDGQNKLRVAINVAPSQFRDPAYGDAVATMLLDHGITPDALTLEITEAALTEAGAGCDDILAGFKLRGLNLTLDDFGTGYGSLSSLKRYPFDAIKIDAGFIHSVVSDSHDAAMAKSIIAMGHHLGMKVIAEGVETEAQCDFLRKNMCDQIQGCFFAPPLASTELHQMLDTGRLLPAHMLRIHKPPRRLLLVDDEPNILASLKRLLRGDNYLIHTAGNGPQGLAVLAEHPVDVIVSDQRMPGMLGADFLRKARELAPDTIRIMLSGYTELQSVTDAVNEGAIYKFLTKPWDDEQLRGHIADAFRVKEIADDNQRLHLEVLSANQELAAANRRMEQLLHEKQRQISLGEISLNVARELLQHLPLPVIGMDDAGMIAFINGAAAGLFRHCGALLGNEAGAVLPELFPAGGADADPALDDAGARHLADIDGRRYAVMYYSMGEHSSSRGKLITLNTVEHSR